jgi:hypothetical protein
MGTATTRAWSCSITSDRSVFDPVVCGLAVRPSIARIEMSRRSSQPAPPGWNKTIQDLLDESKRNSSVVGPPEIDWARDYERSLIPVGTRFPKKGDVYEAAHEVEVSYRTTWAAPFTGGGSGSLRKGDRVVIDHEPQPRPMAVNAKPVDYTRVEEELVPESDRVKSKYAGFYLVLKTLELSRNFRLVHSDATSVDYQQLR